MFQLQGTDRTLAIDVLSANFFNTPAPRSRLHSVIGPLALKLPEQNSPNAWATNCLAELEREDWNGDRHPLLELLRVVQALNPAIARIVAQLDAMPRPDNPFLQQRLDSGIFLDRESFRTHVQALLQEDGPCVLRVNGMAKSGRSACFRFLKFLQLQRKPLQPILFKNPKVTTTAAELAGTLVSRMALDPESIPNTAAETPLRTGQILADWVLNRALRNRDRWWFVLDDFADPNLPSDTQEFIRQLGLQIANGVGRDRLRLVLINSEIALPDELRRLQKSDKLALDRPGWEQLLRNYMATFKGSLPAEKAAEADEALQIILEDLAELPDEEFLHALWSGIEDVHDELTA